MHRSKAFDGLSLHVFTTEKCSNFELVRQGQAPYFGTKDVVERMQIGNQIHLGSNPICYLGSFVVVQLLSLVRLSRHA